MYVCMYVCMHVCRPMYVCMHAIFFMIVINRKGIRLSGTGALGMY